MRKEGYRHRKIKRKKVRRNFGFLKQTDKGQAETVAGLFFLLFFGILLCAMLQIELFRTASQYTEDALAASNLASAVIDVEEYGISHTLLISDPLEAFEKYKTALKGNLNLDDAWNCPNRRMIAGPVRILEYIVYNCREGQVFVYHINEEGVLSDWQGPVGAVTAPNGIPVESTSIYSEISFPAEGFPGVKTQARKGKLVDIVLNEEN